MLGGLLGRKFSAKCKQSIKFIKARIFLIRKKKQATLNFLKKDVADLLASGHDANALGRMDGLMVDMHKLSCYDMIERYCDCILGQLSCLEKQRECPQEEVEAVATLIFAAARFSDLPELGDLRKLFINRYGCALESSVNTQFVEKIVTKTFSKDKKLKMMQDISREFSAPWNPELFDQKRIKPSATEVPRKTDLPNSNTKQKNLHAIVNELKDSDIDAQQERGDTIIKQYISSHGKTESAPKYDVLKEIKHTEVKDIHMVANLNNNFQADLTNNSRSVFFDEHKNSKPSNTPTTVSYTKPGHILNEQSIEEQQDVAISSKKRSPRSHEKDNHLRERQVKELESTFDRPNVAAHIKSKGYERSNTYDKLDSLHGFCSFVGEAKVAGTVKSHDKKERSDTIGQSSREPNYNRTQIILPHINGKRLGNDGNHPMGYHENNRAAGMSDSPNKKTELLKSLDDKRESDSDEQHAREMKGNHGVSRNMVSPYMDMKRQYFGNHAIDYLKDGSGSGDSSTQEGLLSSVPEKQVAGLDKHVGDRVKNMIPPYVKPVLSKAGFHTKEHGCRLRSQQHLEPPSEEQEAFQDVKPVGNHAVAYKDSSASIVSNTLEGLHFSVPERQLSEPNKHVNNRVENMIPPYVRQTGSMAGVVAKEKDCHATGSGNKLRNLNDLVPPSQEQKKFEGVKSACILSPNIMIPPYVKSDANKKSYQVEHLYSAISTRRDRDSDASVCSRSRGNELNNLMEVELDSINKPMPRSVRSKHSKLQMVQEKNNSIDDTGSISTKIGSERKHGERLLANIVEDEQASDEEEIFVDKLLMHYSRKGMTHQKSKSRRRSRTEKADNSVESSEARKGHRDHHDARADIPEEVHTFERAFSLPSRQMDRADVGKPVRMPSMEPDMLTPRGGRVHPRMPDYDDLMARFNALKRS